MCCYIQKADVALRMLSTFMQTACLSLTLSSAASLQYLLSAAMRDSDTGRVLERILYSPVRAASTVVFLREPVQAASTAIRERKMSRQDLGPLLFNTWVTSEVRM